MPPSRRPLSTFVLVLMLALALRTHDMGASLPHRAEGDASHVVQSALLRSGEEHPERNPEFGRYPLLVPYLDQLVPYTEPGEVETLEQHLEAAGYGHLRIRWIVALLATAIVPATWALARIFLAPWGALFATLLTATSLLHLAFSQQARPHASSVPFVILAVVSCVRLARRGTRGDYLRAGAWIGIGLGTLQSALSLVGPLTVAHVLVLRRKGARHFPSIGWALLPIGLCVLIFYPFLLSVGSGAEGATVKLGKGGLLEQSGHLVYLNLFNGLGAPTILRTLWYYEPVSVVLAAVGLVALGTRARSVRRTDVRRGDLLVVLAHALPYALVVCLYQRSLERFAIPLLPYLAILAALGAGALLAAARGRIARPSVAVLLGVGPLILAAQHVRVRSAPDTIAQAAEWLEANVDPGAPVAVMLPTDLPLAWSEEARAWNTVQPVPDGMRYPWLAYVAERLPMEFPAPRWNLRWVPVLGVKEREEARKNPARPVKSTGGEFLVLEHFAPRQHDPLLVRIGSWAERNAELQLRFSPRGRGVQDPAALTYVAPPRRVPGPHYAWHLLHAQALGPVVEIYRLPGATKGDK